MNIEQQPDVSELIQSQSPKLEDKKCQKRQRED